MGIPTSRASAEFFYGLLSGLSAKESQFGCVHGALLITTLAFDHGHARADAAVRQGRAKAF
jgi:hypothetical protein